MKKVNYWVREGVKLVNCGEDSYLLSELPLIVVKVNKALYDILCEMKRSSTLSCAPEKDRPLMDLLDRLVTKGLLVREDVIEVQAHLTISIIVPVKNRSQDIRDCLRSLELLDYPKDNVEVIVVDDASTDSTPQTIQTFKVKGICLTESIGAPACRNLAIKEAKGELIGFIDSDCVPHPQWLKELVPYFEDRRIGIVGGYVSSFYSHSSLERYEDAKSPLNMGPHFVRADGVKLSHFYVPSCNLMVWKRAFFEAGGFQEDLHVGEDVDLCWRIRKLGYQLLYVPRGEVKHKHRNNVLAMLKRRFDYGTSEAILYLKHRDKRKTLYLPALYSVFYVSICLGIIMQYPRLFFLGMGMLLIDFCRKYLRMKKTRLGLRCSRIFLSGVRSHFSFCYFTSSFLTRYYIIFFALLSVSYSKMWVFLLFLLFFSAIVDFSIKRPKINLFSFLFFYTMDQLAYQVGVLWGCCAKKTLIPYVPIVITKL